MDSTHYNAALALNVMLLILILCSCCLQNFLICKVLLILLVISLYQLVKYLAFL